MLSENELREWVKSLNNIPACWPVRDAILALLNTDAKKRGEDGKIAEGAGAVVRLVRRVKELESLLADQQKRLDRLLEESARNGSNESRRHEDLAAKIVGVAGIADTLRARIDEAGVWMNSHVAHLIKRITKLEKAEKDRSAKPSPNGKSAPKASKK